MSNAQELQYISEQQYLADEQQREIKHQLIDGQVYAMSGASVNHNRICANLIGEFMQHLKNSPCEPFGSDMKIKANNNFFYPDMSVVCDFNEQQPIYTNSPVIIIEVLSNSTRRFDTSIKRLNYINLPSLEEYVLIEQDFVNIEVMRKNQDWQSRHYFLEDKITFESINVTLEVKDIYARVKNQDLSGG